MKLRPAVHSVIFNLKNLNVFIYLERVCVSVCVRRQLTEVSPIFPSFGAWDCTHWSGLAVNAFT